MSGSMHGQNATACTFLQIQHLQSLALICLGSDIHPPFLSTRRRQLLVKLGDFRATVISICHALKRCSAVLAARHCSPSMLVRARRKTLEPNAVPTSHPEATLISSLPKFRHCTPAPVKAYPRASSWHPSPSPHFHQGHRPSSESRQQ